MKAILHCALSLAAVATATVLGGGVNSASAQATQFRGYACIITATASCSAEGWSVGSCGTARFSPPNWNGNPNRTGLSIYWGSFYANNIMYQGSLVGSVFRPVQGGGIGDTIFQFATGTTARIGGQVPATLAPGTPMLSSTVFINKFNGRAGCNVAIRFQGQRHPLP